MTVPATHPSRNAHAPAPLHPLVGSIPLAIIIIHTHKFCAILVRPQNATNQTQFFHLASLAFYSSICCLGYVAGRLNALCPLPAPPPFIRTGQVESEMRKLAVRVFFSFRGQAILLHSPPPPPPSAFILACAFKIECHE